MNDLNYENQDLSGCDFTNKDLRYANFRNCNLSGCDFRKSNLSYANICGANLFGCSLENAVLDNIVFDKNTKFFEMRCPTTGAFLGYKKCYNNRIVQLLIPADAKRTSSTYHACRCDKAKVLTIKSIDLKESYSEASSYVDDLFVYKVGEYCYADNFNEDRWVDSTTGIHFFMSREEAIGYL